MENFLFKISIFVIIILIRLSSFISFVEAQQPFIQIQNPLQWENISEIINAIVGWIFWLAVALVPLLILVGAFYIMTSGGSRERVSKGKRIIFYALVGLFLVLLARGIISIIRVVLGLT